MTGTLILIAVGFTMAGVGLVLLWPRISERRRARRLHDRLAAANGLQVDESEWLWQLAQRATADRPASVFVRPSLLETGPGAPSAAMAQAVHAKLFAN
ncbi:MAG: hypothetical protein NXI31_15355 [bacterium]|nr:hypothetical protein [bacterium]